ncbi:MAG: hypothetical protein WAU78_15785 [Roseiarcus sp.]|jgi:hypothetical protein
MTETVRSALKKVTLHAARSKEFPDGSIRHGYRFAAPLTQEGRIDVEAWKARRGECIVHRFWGDEPSQRGLLAHRPGGRGGSSWAFEYGSVAAPDEEEAGYRLGDHVFRVGEYVSIREGDGELTTFKVVDVS